MRGRIFDIEEFAVFDGPGIRSVVFLKGCPLRCQWCHNPEGLDAGPTRVTQIALCAHCGACDAVCPSPARCVGCGKCKDACPKNIISIAGVETEAAEVASKVLKNAKLLQMNGGGVTFSGGEPLMQPDFLLDVRSRLSSLHACMETSGYAPGEVFSRAASAMDFVIMDVKLVDSAAHLRYTGVDNARILENLRWLKASNIPFRVRVPLIPGVTDTRENLSAVAALLPDVKTLEKVELLPYHRAAGAKYASVRRVYAPEFDPERPVNADVSPFVRLGIPAEAL